MKINSVRYCDVCGKRIGDLENGGYVFLNEVNEATERHYCSDHMFMGEKFQKLICHEASDDIFESNCKNHKNYLTSKERNKEITNLEMYDILSKLFEKHYGYLFDYFGKTLGIDDEVMQYNKNLLSADIAYNRLKVKGKIKKEKEEIKC